MKQRSVDLNQKISLFYFLPLSRSFPPVGLAHGSSPVLQKTGSTIVPWAFVWETESARFSLFLISMCVTVKGHMLSQQQRIFTKSNWQRFCRRPLQSSERTTSCLYTETIWASKSCGNIRSHFCSHTYKTVGVLFFTHADTFNHFSVCVVIKRKK